jgi:hypothetical protein
MKFHVVHVSGIPALKSRLKKAGFASMELQQSEALRMHHKDGRIALAWEKKHSPFRKVNPVAWDIYNNTLTAQAKE